MAIEITDTKLTYVPIREARVMSGLRIVLGEFAIPGPWHEACKGVFHVKGLDYTRVRSSNEGASDAQIGMDGTQSELIAWTGQSSAPVVVYDDERPRSLWNDQLYLAERLQPEPPLIPDDPHDRVTMFGLANELLGENGLVYRVLTLPEGSALTGGSVARESLRVDMERSLHEHRASRGAREGSTEPNVR